MCVVARSRSAPPPLVARSIAVIALRPSYFTGWVPSIVMEVKLLRLVDEGLLLPPEVTRWRAVASEAFLDPWPEETVSFTDFHEHGFRIPASDFLPRFLQEYGVQLQHIPPNGLLQLAGFVVVYEAFLGIKPNKDLFRWLFEVKSWKVQGSNGGVLTPVGGMNIQMCPRVSHHYSCLLLKSSNLG